MNVAREIKKITQKEFQDYVKKLIKNCELVIETQAVKKDALQSLLWELEGYKIVEEKK